MGHHGSCNEGHEEGRCHRLDCKRCFCQGGRKHGAQAEASQGCCPSYVELAAGELKKNGKFKLGGLLNMKLKKKPAVAARKGVNPFTKEPCVFKAKPASKTVRVLPMKKLKLMVN